MQKPLALQVDPKDHVELPLYLLDSLQVFMPFAIE